MTTLPLALLDLTHPQLADLLVSWGEPRYRADQVWNWLYRRLAVHPAAMTNLPQSLRTRLEAEAYVDPLELVHSQPSSDRKTHKWLFRLPDGLTIETVLMHYPPDEGPDEGRRTVCISTQAGCAMGCVFCATGQAGLARNLTPGEIIAQVLTAERPSMGQPVAQRWLASQGQLPDVEDRMLPSSDIHAEQVGHSPSATQRWLTNVVVMGMGEPLANYDHTWQALAALTDKDGFNLGARHITLSTVGLPTGIRRMAEEPLQIGLAVSLHAPNDALREQLVPIGRRYPLSEVMAAVREYIARTRRRVTFEYALMRDINDTPTLALELVALLRGLLCHVNLIPLNPVAESPYQPSTPQQAAAFQTTLERAGIPTTMRQRRGVDIDAGCGQLRRRIAQK